MRNQVTNAWYTEKPTLLSRVLYPFSLLFRIVVAIRQRLYRWHVLASQSFSVPIIVVGNITVGGTGKTPMVLYLLELLKKEGYRPGVVSRGYGGIANKPMFVTPESDVKHVGDEALLIASRIDCPVVVGKNRSLAVKHLLKGSDCDVIISDDGLQHYAMRRDMEIAMLDGQRRLGNMHCLPAGPLREPVDRLRHVDAIVITEGEAFNDEYAMSLEPADALVSLSDEAKTFPVSQLAHQTVHALAGIGNPARFFSTLTKLGADVKKHPFPDHHVYEQKDFDFANDQLVVMTEKDAVKCRSFAVQNAWYLPIKASLSSTFDEFMLKRLDNILSQKRGAEK